VRSTTTDRNSPGPRFDRWEGTVTGCGKNRPNDRTRRTSRYLPTVLVVKPNSPRKARAIGPPGCGRGDKENCAEKRRFQKTSIGESRIFLYPGGEAGENGIPRQRSRDFQAATTMARPKISEAAWEVFLDVSDRLEIDVRGLREDVRFHALESAGHALGRAVAPMTTERPSVCHCSACRRDFFPSASRVGARPAER